MNDGLQGEDMPAPYALVIEDDPHIADIFKRALQDSGFSSDVISDPHKAQAHLVFSTPDLVLLDIHLPRISGEVILRQLQGKRRFHRTHILIVTGDPEMGARYADKVEDVLIKPIGYEDLRERAKLILSQV